MSSKTVGRPELETIQSGCVGLCAEIVALCRETLFHREKSPAIEQVYAHLNAAFRELHDAGQKCEQLRENPVLSEADA